MSNPEKIAVLQSSSSDLASPVEAKLQRCFDCMPSCNPVIPLKRIQVDRTTRSFGQHIRCKTDFCGGISVRQTVAHLGSLHIQCSYTRLDLTLGAKAMAHNPLTAIFQSFISKAGNKRISFGF